MPDRLATLADAASHALPHAGTARLVHQILESDEESMLCIARFPAASALVVDGQAATHLVVEAAAQAAATHMAILVAGEGEPVRGFVGFLTSTRNVEVFRPSLPADTDIQVRVRPRSGIRRGKSGLYKHGFEACYEGEIVVRGELSSFVTPQEA